MVHFQCVQRDLNQTITFPAYAPASTEEIASPGARTTVVSVGPGVGQTVEETKVSWWYCHDVTALKSRIFKLIITILREEILSKLHLRYVIGAISH